MPAAMTLPPFTRRAFVRTAIFSSLAMNASAAPPDRLRVAVIGHTGAGDYGHGMDTLWLALPETEIVGVGRNRARQIRSRRRSMRNTEICSIRRAGGHAA